jgi:cell division protein FtsB
MQLEDVKSRQFDLNLSLTKESSPVSELRRDSELEFLKKRNSDLDAQIRSLKEELYSAKVEREKYHDKYGMVEEDNRMLKDQIFNLKKLLLEFEKKDYSLSQKLQVIDSRH